MGFAIAGALVGLGGSIGGAVLKHGGEDAALTAQAKALKALKAIDINEVSDLATQTDIEKFRTQLETLAKEDPQFGALRSQGAKELLAGISEDRVARETFGKEISDQLEKLKAGGPEAESVIAGLVDRAQADLKAGATLPPEFQAELVRSGLASAGARGESIEGRGQAGVGVRRLIGSEGLALKERREDRATQNLNAADALRSNRASILGSLAELDNNLRAARGQRAFGAAQLGMAATPNIGISGTDAANLSIKNTDFENARIQGLADIRAQKKLSKSEMWQSILSSSTSAISGLLGGMGGISGGGGFLGGGAGAGGGGGMGSGFNYIGGLFSTNRQSPSLANNYYTPGWNVSAPAPAGGDWSRLP